MDPLVVALGARVEPMDAYDYSDPAGGDDRAIELQSSQYSGHARA